MSSEPPPGIVRVRQAVGMAELVQQRLETRTALHQALLRVEAPPAASDVEHADALVERRTPGPAGRSRRRYWSDES
jgi:hypothetical protein